MNLRRLFAGWVLLAAVACSSPPSSPGRSNASGGTPEPSTALEAAPLDVEPGPADPRERVLAHALSQMLSGQHVRRHRVDDEVSRQAFDELVERLDAGKLFLLAPHVEQLRAYADQMDDQLEAGDLKLGRLGTAFLVARQEVVAEIVAGILAEPFDFTVEEEIETDPDEVDFAATDEQLADRWRRLLKLQVLERIAQMQDIAEALAAGEGDALDAGVRATHGDIPETFEGRERKAREDLAKTYAGRFKRLARLEPLEPAEVFLNAIASVYDPHTLYLPPIDKQNFDIDISGSLEGIGAVLSEDDHYIVVREIVPGGAAWRQGDLQAGDLILAVAQAGEDPVDVADMRINEAVQMIRGPKGTVVTLTVKKPDNTVESIAITRDVVVIEAAYARGALLRRGPKQPPIGYIYLPQFYGDTRSRGKRVGDRNATDDVRALLDKFRAKKVAGVVLDLRNNGGGLLDHARDISGLFIETGPIVQAQYADGDGQVLRDEDPSISFDGPVVVLVNRFSASASEILAGAMQDYRRAIVIGTGPTHGKGTVQVLLDLDRMSGGGSQSFGVMKLTIQQYFRVNGESTQSRGVIPDIVLPDPFAHVETGERFLDHAIPWSKVEPLEYEVWPKVSWNAAALAEASAARLAAGDAFDAVIARAKFLEKRAKQTRVPLAREAWFARRAERSEKLEQLEALEQKTEPRFTVDLVRYRRKAKAEDERAAAAAAKRIAQWQDALARDPWVGEAIHVLADMAAKP